MKRFPKSAALALPSLLFALQTSDLGATVIVADTFSGGAGSALNGTNATTFNSGITAAGGSATWVANSAYNANGTLTSTSGSAPNNIQSTSATLALGSYIWDARGTASGQFTLTATFSEVTGGFTAAETRWISLGFFTQRPTTTQAFWNGGGMATAVLRQTDANANNYFVGPTTGGGVNPGSITGAVTFTIEIDLRSWNPANSNYGTVTFSNSVTSGSTIRSLPNDNGTNPFQYLGFSGNTDSNSVPGPASAITNFSLSQIPEPASLILAPLGLATLLRRRRTA